MDSLLKPCIANCTTRTHLSATRKPLQKTRPDFTGFNHPRDSFTALADSQKTGAPLRQTDPRDDDILPGIADEANTCIRIKAQGSEHKAQGSVILIQPQRVVQRQSTDVTATDDLTIRQKIVRARKLLEETEKPVKEIASETGFCNIAYFVNTFRREVGETPRRYRSRLR